MNESESDYTNEDRSATTDNDNDSSPLAFDNDGTGHQCREFLEALFGNTDDYIDVRFIKPDGPTDRWPASGITEALEAINALGDDQNVYVGIATRRTGGTAPRNGGKKNLAMASALWADIDFKRSEDQEAFEALLAAFPFPPSIKVHSGGGLHLYWLLDEPYDLETEEAIESFERVLKGLADHFDGDRAVTDASRVLRVPGTINYPDEKKRQRERVPALCRLLSCEPSRRYRFEDFAEFAERGGSAATADLIEYEPRDWDGSLPDRVKEVLEKRTPAGNPRFPKLRSRWEGNVEGLKDMSDSSLDMAIADLLAAAEELEGWEIEHALRYRHSEAGAKQKRTDYYRRTVKKALAAESKTNRKVDQGIASNSPFFEEFIPLDKEEGPPFPVGVLNDWLEDFAEAQAEALQVPIDVIAMLGVAAVSTAVAGKMDVEVHNGYREPLNIFTVSVLPSGNRKSAAFRQATRPIRDFERESRNSAQPAEREFAARIALFEKRVDERKKEAAKANDGDRETKEEEYLKAVAELDREKAKRPKPERLICDDVTPEKLANLLHENDGRIAAWSAEGGELFELMGGRYSSNRRPNIGVFLQGHAGDPLIVDRVSRLAPIAVDKPCLTIAATAQPSVISSLSDQRTFSDRGLLGRFYYVLPKSPLGSRKVKPAPVPADVLRRYSDRITDLLRIKVREQTICLSESASDRWHRLSGEIEPRLGDGGNLQGMTDWGGKFAGAVARIAGLLHVAGCPTSKPWETPITHETMEQAIRLGHYLLAHAKVAFSLMANDKPHAGAAKAWRWIASRGCTEFRKSEIWQGVKRGRIANVKDLEGCLQILIDRGYLAKMSPAQSSPGRPAEWFAVNPEALEWTRR